MAVEFQKKSKKVILGSQASYDPENAADCASLLMLAVGDRGIRPNQPGQENGKFPFFASVLAVEILEEEGPYWHSRLNAWGPEIFM